MALMFVTIQIKMAIKKITGKMDISKLNNQRNEYMDEIIDIEEVQYPAYYRKMMEFKGKMALSTKKKVILWNKIKDIHKEVKGDEK